MTKTLTILAMLFVLATPSFAGQWDDDYEALREQVRQRQFEAALAASARMLETAEQDYHITATTSERLAAFRGLKQYNALMLEAKLLPTSRFGEKKGLPAKLLTAYGSALSDSQQYELAVEVFRLVLTHCAEDKAACARVRLSIGDLYWWRMKDSQLRAVDEYLAVERDYPDQVEQSAVALRRAAEVCYQIKDYAHSEKICRRALEKLRASYSNGDVEWLAVRIGECLEAMEKPEEAAVAYLEAEENAATRLGVQCEMAWRRGLLFEKLKRGADSEMAFERTIARYRMVTPDRAKYAARKIIEMREAEKRYAEAVAMARVCIEDDLDWVLPRVVSCLKALDGNDARVEQFINRGMSGPVDKDGNEYPDVLTAFGMPKYPAQIEKDFDASLAALEGDWQSERRKGELLQYRGRPIEAAKHFYRALMLCEDAGQLRNIRNDLVSGPYFVLHGTPVGGEKWMEYLRTGTVEGGMDDEMKTVFAWKRVERQQNAQLDRAIQVLEKFVTEPFPAGANAREENYRRQVMLSAYFRIAVEKGREDDFIRFCGNVLAEPRHGAIYDDCIILGARCHRMRDGHMAEEFRFVEALAARSSAVSSHARQVAQQYLQRLNAVADWPKTHNIGAYRRYLPPKPKKK